MKYRSNYWYFVFLSVAPKIIMPDIVTVRAGSKMTIEAIVAGKPAPVCKWKQGNEDVLTSDRLSIVKTLTTTSLIIKNVTRKDSGYYSLSAENSTAKINQILKVIVMGKLEQRLFTPLVLVNTSAVLCPAFHYQHVCCLCLRHPWTPWSSFGDHWTGHGCVHTALELATGGWW